VADAQLAQILQPIEARGPFEKTRTTVIVLGDHGFYDYDKVIHLNVLFAAEGWLRVEDQKTGKIAPDWRVITHPSGGTAAIYSRDPKLGPKIISLLRKNARGAYRVIDRRELDKLGAFPGAVCAVDLATTSPGADGKPGPGYSMGKEAQGTLLVPADHVRGNHGPMPTDPRLRTGFITVGPGIAPGTKLGLVKLIDVAPTVAKILKVELKGVEGKPINLNQNR
jgi:predicted AlkP superfamily pyrophosphatase or phosphodiesterase